jgi:uncharacterized membrane protein YhhN
LDAPNRLLEHTMIAASSEPARQRIISTIYGAGALLLLAGVLFGKRDAAGTNRIPKPLRMLSSALVLTCALLLRRGQPRARHHQAELVAAGMGSGFVGDLIMAKLIPLPEHVLFGMLAFGVGHTCYIRAFLRHAPPGTPIEQHGLIHQETRRNTKKRFLYSITSHAAKARWVALGTAWLVALIGWWALVRNPKLNPALNYGALAYALLLSSMSGLAGALAYTDRRYMPVAAGGVLFLASDMLLASELFRGTHFPQIGDVVWLTYISGQGLIVAGMGLATEQPASGVVPPVS